MKRLPKMWRKKNRQGKQVGNWLAKVEGDTVNLGTKDAELARKHLREAVQGRREFTDEIDDAAAALGDTAATPAAAPLVQDPLPAAAQAAQAPPAAAAPATPAAFAALPPLPASQPPPDPQDFADTADAASEAAEAAASATPGGRGGPAGDPDVLEITNDQLADLGVEAQVWIAAWHARRKVYKGFIPPPTPAELRAPIAEKWKTILTYAGAAAVMPPWVSGLLIPGATLVMATAALASGFSAIAEEQRVKAGAPSQATEPAAAS